MNEQALQGRIAFITGAGSGMGAAFARRIAADGAFVVVNDLDDGAAEAVAKEVGGETAVFDVTDSGAFTAAVDDAAARHGRLDIMINNAGIAPPFDQAKVDRALANAALRMEGRIAEMPPHDVLTQLSDADWDRMIKVHLYGAFYGCRAALRHMQAARRGVIVNVASILGLWPSAGAPDYSTAKAAIIALTKSVAGEVAHLGIRVNAICPGYVETPLLATLTPELRQGVLMQIAAGRMAQPEELAEVVRFLVGDEASYCNGDIWSASGAYR
jgi:NAD(P)-dependent dehydrogenase (short-subunit alcohol dehydrogenase family)